jgi:S1-C subfamily serine protease
MTPRVVTDVRRRRRAAGRMALWLAPWLLTMLALPAQAAESSFAEVISGVQPKIVKIFGAGGLRGLEPYQSGLLISAQGHVLTVWSYVLDSDVITVVLDDGRRYEAQLVGSDPRTEIAVLKIDADAVQYFDIGQTQEALLGSRVLAFSNLFGVATGDEASSVLHGNVAAKTQLNARRGAFQSTYQGPVLILDAITNNPGAAGGALTDQHGRFLGLLGKELRNSLTNTWLNYAIPAAELNEPIQDILAGRTPTRRQDETQLKPTAPVTRSLLGITMIPDVLPKTPPFVDAVIPGSPADRAGIQPDDLILFVNDHLATSCRVLRDELTYIDRIDEVRLTIQRSQELLEVVLRADP